MSSPHFRNVDFLLQDSLNRRVLCHISLMLRHLCYLGFRNVILGLHLHYFFYFYKLSVDPIISYRSNESTGNRYLRMSLISLFFKLVRLSPFCPCASENLEVQIRLQFCDCLHNWLGFLIQIFVIGVVKEVRKAEAILRGKFLPN